ncbi:hypothetical protein JL720_13121 [Aureococcus anophagefferens]|nr:hypothetical protein JL720_13121 [Aureococcus anophagefferens]
MSPLMFLMVHHACARAEVPIVMSGWAQQRKPTALQQLETLERPPTALARDEKARSALVDGFASGLSVVELRGCWDACVGEACGVAAAAVAASPGKRTPRLATREPACRALLKRCAGLVVEARRGADGRVPSECGLQMAELGWPARRDDADAFFVHGYMHASACVTLAVLSRAGQESEIPNFKGSFLGRFPLVLADFWTSDHLSERNGRDFAVRAGARVGPSSVSVAGEYAAVVGNLATRRPVVVDLAAAKLGYDPRDLLKRVVARSRFLILDASTFLDRVEALGVFRRRPMPAWAPAASPEAFAALLPTLPAADRWARSPRQRRAGVRASGRRRVARPPRARGAAFGRRLAGLGPADRRRAAAATLLGNRGLRRGGGGDVAAALDCLGARVDYPGGLDLVVVGEAANSPWAALAAAHDAVTSSSRRRGLAGHVDADEANAALESARRRAGLRRGADFDRPARAPSAGGGDGRRARRALDARGRVTAVRRFDASQAPENARSFLRDARTSYGFSLAYDRAYAAAHPFEADRPRRGRQVRRSADPRVVCYHRDASASCLHVQHGENATKSVALESAGPDFLAASPLAAVVDAGFFAPRASDGDAAGLFVFDAARAATAGDDDQPGASSSTSSAGGPREDRGASSASRRAFVARRARRVVRHEGTYTKGREGVGSLGAWARLGRGLA